MKFIGLWGGLLVAGLALCPSSASACEPGDQLELTGNVSRIYPNKAGRWTITVADLNEEIASCDTIEVFGQKAPGGPWFVFDVKNKPSPQCRPGSPVSATVKVTDEGFFLATEVVRWRCN